MVDGSGAPWWKGATVYQVYPRSFADSTGTGVGDLDGIRRKLDYINSLGVDAIWLSPIFPSPNRDFGYDVADYCNIAPEMGSLDTFDKLTEEVHERGMKLILDQVLAHSSDQHDWFKESLLSQDSEKSNWYVWADAKEDGTPPNNWMSAFGGSAWSWHPVRRQYYHHKFLKQQPKLNFHEPAVVAALMDVLRFWLDRGVDGFRLDVAHAYVHDLSLTDNLPVPRDQRTGLDWSHAPRLQQHRHDSGLPENKSAMQSVRAVLDEYENRFAFGEFAETPDMIGDYVGEPDRLHTAYTFDFLEDRTRAPAVFESYYKDVIEKNGDPWPCVTFSNHDITRPVTRWGGEKDDAPLAKYGLALLMALRGTALLYQGEELGLPDVDLLHEEIRDPVGDLYYPFGKGRDGCRTPMPWDPELPQAGFSTGTPWLPIPDYHYPLAVKNQEASRSSVLQFARAAIAFRQNHPAIKTGKITFHESGDALLVFNRSNDEQNILCMFNPGPEEAAWPADQMSKVLGPDFTQCEFGVGQCVREEKWIRLAPRSAAFFC
jgi:alpha-glucosidase